MREIKCRVWDSEENRMLYFQTPVVDKSQAVIMACNGRKENWIDTHIMSMEVMETMWYTGLHDKNGEEIYEGDAVEILKWNKVFVGEIVFLQCAYVMVEKNSEPKIFHNLGWGYDSIKIIGNIYENPELIGKHESTK